MIARRLGPLLASTLSMILLGACGDVEQVRQGEEPSAVKAKPQQLAQQARVGSESSKRQTHDVRPGERRAAPDEPKVPRKPGEHGRQSDREAASAGAPITIGNAKSRSARLEGEIDRRASKIRSGASAAK